VNPVPKRNNTSLGRCAQIYQSSGGQLDFGGFAISRVIEELRKFANKSNKPLGSTIRPALIYVVVVQF
jgi:hypothetical protein